ncbi:MAG TPA: ComF family protein [Polyangiaceae bacterium]|jgi:ComF family protein|nr:ComF family protein [Polyangiaceae bacterium]
MLDGIPLIVAGAFTPPLSPAIRRMKFEGAPELARELSLLLSARLLALELGDGAGFVPVPLHRARLVERGFNQAALLARALADRAGGDFAPRALERLKRTEQQARLGKGDRRLNVQGAFAARRGSVPRRALLVDDVVTTGATALACISALKNAECEVLAVVALARADNRS